VYPFQHPDFV
jgi:hypothetical protein